MGSWNTSPSWNDFDNINGGQQFSNRLSPEDLNKLAENIAYLYENQGENEYLGEYAGGTYLKGAIVKYSDGNIYLCIKDTDDEQVPTNAEYWQMLNEEGEEIPEISEALALTASTDGAEEGELVIAYSLSEKVALPTGTNKQLGLVEDADFIASNIKSGANIFGLEGTYEGEVIEEYDGTIVIETEEAEDELAGTWVLNTDIGGWTDGNASFYIEGSFNCYDGSNNLQLGVPIECFSLYNITGSGTTFTNVQIDSGLTYINSDLGFPQEFMIYQVYYSRTGTYKGYVITENGHVKKCAPESDEGLKVRTFTITSKLSEVTNGDILLTWLKANATKQ